MMPALHGHKEAAAAFLAGVASGRLHHAWLISGPMGIGKALFADKAALRVLADAAGPRSPDNGLEVDPEHPIARLASAGSHPDLARLERLPRDSGTDLARSITVAQVRGLQRLFATTPSMSPWRAVVIDAVDDLERGGANALLKNLEEPPPDTIFLLVSHAPDLLLPTIRSRCRHLRLGLLDDDAMASALEAAMPDARADERRALAIAGAGSPGRAAAFRGLQVDALDQAMAELLAQGDATNARRSRLAQTLALKAAQPRYELFLSRAPSFIAAEARRRRGAALAAALDAWERAASLASGAIRLSLDPHAVAFELAGMIAGLAPATGTEMG